jgi:hypothetical protein
MQYLISVALFVFPVALGMLSFWSRRRKLNNKLHDVSTFLGQFTEWVDGDCQDDTVYDELTAKSTVIQSRIGSFGLGAIRRPQELVYHTNVQVIVNLLPDVRRYLNDRYGVLRDQGNDYARMVADCLIRYSGATEEALLKLSRRSRNPIDLYLEGVRCVVSLPFVLLRKSEIVSEEAYSSLVRNWLFKLFSFVAAFAAFLSTLMSVVVGWGDFVDRVKSMF